ncbi:MAG: sigma-E factor negative regulatory protein [Woeseiaceae bacterium]
MNDGIKMQISAFVDGELPEAEAQLLLRRLSQDVELRQQAAEYFAIGRAMRGQGSFAESGVLRTRIAAAIDDRLTDMEFDEIEPVGRRYARPLAGFAIAATVAMVAIFGLQQMTVEPGISSGAAVTTAAEDAIDESYTVPDIDYFQRHSEFSSEVGNNNFDFRRVNAELDKAVELEGGREEIEPPQDATQVEPTE